MADSRTPLFRNRYRVASARWTGWDYRRPGMYFVTVCVQGRDECLGSVSGATASPSALGEIVGREWQGIPLREPRASLDAWIVMPDHLHGIIVLGPAQSDTEASLGMIVGQFKSKSTKGIRTLGHHAFTWQERFHDRIIENLDELERIRAYIRQNPERWQAKRNK